MAKQSKKRADHYEPKIKVKEGTEFIDVINASLKLTKKAPAKSAKKKG